MNSPLALVAAVFHMMNHATFKASLFMAAGIVDHETGTRDLQSPARPRPRHAHHRDARHRGRPRPWPACRCSMDSSRRKCSSPKPFSRAKRSGCASACRPSRRSPACSAWRIRCGWCIARSSVRRAQGLPRAPHDPNRWMLAPSALLVSACMLVGICPQHTIGPFLDSAARALLGTHVPEYSLAVWHGVTLPLIMSAIALDRRRRAVSCCCSATDGALAPAPLSRPLDARRGFKVSMVVLMRTRGPPAEHAFHPAPAAAAGAHRLRDGGRRRLHGAAAPPFSIDHLRLTPVESGVRAAVGRSARPARSARPRRRSTTAWPR